MHRILVAVIVVVLGTGAAKGQFRHGGGMTESAPDHCAMIPLSLKLALTAPGPSPETYEDESPGPYEKKSPMLAGVLSIALPGAGQYYAKSYWAAAGFFAAEAFLWIAYAVKTGEADKKTEEFQRFADDHFSVVRYARWIENNATYYSLTNVSGMYDLTKGSAPWEQIDWGRLNEVEAQIGLVAGSGFSHRLPVRPEQQYFELIGKYPQFGGGWDDAGSFGPADVVSDRVSAKFLAYRQMRGDANSLYNFATGTSFIIVANHVLGALHAAWSTSRWNRSIEATVHLKRISFLSESVEYVPYVSVRLLL
jgi:hypothetical protein